MAEQPLEVLVATFPDVADESTHIPLDIDLPPSTACVEYRQEERQAGRYTVITTKRYIVSAPTPKGTK